MLMECRRNGVCVLAAAWLAVPILFTYALINNMADNSVLIYLFGSFVMIAIGVIAYAGNYKFISGFNTMSEEEQKEYNGDEISGVTGLFFSGIAYVSGAGSLAIAVYYGNLASVVFFVSSVLAPMFTWAIYVAVGKRFKA